ncbi:MAG: hypothetical protein AABY18_04550 [Candidatus Thermoplasmatota archaeon]
MDRTQVAAFYRGKGYLVHESIVVTGQSGNQQRVPLLCEGPLGNLAVFFGDAAGIDGPEIGAAKRVAKDLGATAVVAAGTFTTDQRRTAAELGVVLLDAASMEAPAPLPVPSAWPGQAPGAALERDLEAHPWPASGRPGGVDGPSRSVAYDVDELLGRFERAKPADTVTVDATPPAPANSPAPTPAAMAPRASRADDGGLWKQPRTAPAAVAVAQPTASRKAGNGPAFAWLNLPQAPAPAAETEYSGTVAARAATPAAVPLTPEQLAAQKQERLLREAMVRVWIRRGAWMLGAAVFVYLFLLWWL